MATVVQTPSPFYGPCYWGRVAPLQEWLEWLRWADEVDLDNPSKGVPLVCAACRQLAGPGK